MRRLLWLFLLLTLWWSAVAAVYAEALLPMARRAQPDLAIGAVLVANWLGWLVWAPVSLLCIAAVTGVFHSRCRWEEDVAWTRNGFAVPRMESP